MKNNLIFTAQEAVRQLTEEFSAVSDTPRLDAELLTAMALEYSRACAICQWVQVLTDRQQQQLQQNALRRLNGEPMAYILGLSGILGIKIICEY